MAPASDNHGSASASRWRCSSASRHPIAQLGEAERLYGEEWSCQRLAERLYGEEWSCQRLAERYGCDDETVRQR
jgi:hypothetical protein